jgi:hypothetical protein
MQPECKADNLNLLSRQCGTLDISQPYRPQGPVTGIALLFCVLFILSNVSLQYLPGMIHVF